MFIDPVTAAKFNVIGSDPKKIRAALNKVVDADNLQTRYGGNLEDNDVQGRVMNLQLESHGFYPCRGQHVSVEDLNTEKYDKRFYIYPSPNKGAFDAEIRRGLGDLCINVTLSFAFPLPPSHFLQVQNAIMTSPKWEQIMF